MDIKETIERLNTELELSPSTDYFRECIGYKYNNGTVLEYNLEDRTIKYYVEYYNSGILKIASILFFCNSSDAFIEKWLTNILKHSNK